jgi:hypothetical protein
MQSDGEAECRRRYGDWLQREGVKNFGDPLDHGDAEDAVGDADVRRRPTSPRPPPPPRRR